jgi:hypothetical protein
MDRVVRVQLKRSEQNRGVLAASDGNGGDGKYARTHLNSYLYIFHAQCPLNVIRK